MKIHFLLSTALLLVTASCFSQAQKIRQTEQKKAPPPSGTAVLNPAIKPIHLKECLQGLSQKLSLQIRFTKNKIP
jgi:hypothetical protein